MKACTLATAVVVAMSQLRIAYGKTTNFNANFDNLTVVPDKGRASPVGVYLGISFPNFDLDQNDIELAGLVVQSKPNYVFGVGSASSPAAMTVSYPGSKAKSLALSSLYYGCQTDLCQGAAEVPIACNITVTGYKAGSSKAAAVQVFKFSPNGVTSSPMALGMFSAAFQACRLSLMFRAPRR